MDKYEAVKHLIEQGKDATLEDGVVMLRSRATGAALDREYKAMKKRPESSRVQRKPGNPRRETGGGSVRKASMNFKSGVLYTKDGRKLADIDSGVVEWGVQVTAEVPTKSVATVTRNTTETFEGKLLIGHLDVLSLMYGMRITNNWLKMHGGIMARNGGKKKKRRLF